MDGNHARTNADRRGSGQGKEAIATKGTKHNGKRRKAEKRRRAEKSNREGRFFSVLSFPQPLRSPPLLNFFFLRFLYPIS
jgi:hypothetical protein